MSMTNNQNYHSIAKLFHWALVVLIGIQFISAWLMPELEGGMSGDAIVSFHMSFGILVAPLALALFIMRIVSPVSKPEMIVPTWKESLATAMHYVLYILLLLIPLSGWAFASSHGWTVTLFGMTDLPALFPIGSSLGELIGEMHGALTTLIGLLIVGHVAAALYHRFFLKDRVLQRMTPDFSTKKEDQLPM